MTIKAILVLFFLSMVPDRVLPQVRSFLELQKIDGYGPQGTTFHSLNERKNSEFRDLYPAPAHIPENWNETREYYYVFNEKQLIFQSYIEGKINKNTLSELFSKRKYLLQDTLKLSRTSITCGISFIVGKEKDSGLYQYILDRNQNNDFGDEVSKKLSSQDNLFGGDVVGENISYQYFDKNQIIQDEIKLSLSISTDNYVFVSIPQYYLANISLNGKSYFICKNLGSTGVYVVSALPYFGPIKADKRLLVGQYFTIDSIQFRIVNVLLDGKFIEVEGPVTLKDGAITSMVPTSSEKISAQTGFKAPQISGTNVLDGAKLSLDNINDGRYIYLYFWSTTCAPCIQDLKNLTSIANQYKDKIQFIGICDVRSDLDKILSSHNVTWPTLILQKSSIKSADYDIYKYPTSFLLNKNRIVERMDLRSEELRRFLESDMTTR